MNIRFQHALRAIAIGTLVTAGVGAGLGGCAATETRESAGQYADSSLLTGKVKTALARDDMASLLDISVESFRDVVQLSGVVDTEAERLHAAAVAESVTGVARVENSLVVKPAS